MTKRPGAVAVMQRNDVELKFAFGGPIRDRTNAHAPTRRYRHHGSAAILRGLVSIFLYLASVGLSTADVIGVPRILDGDTVEINGVKIRLQGIDAPETDQLCVDADGQRWTC